MNLVLLSLKSCATWGIEFFGNFPKKNNIYWPFAVSNILEAVQTKLLRCTGETQSKEIKMIVGCYCTQKSKIIGKNYYKNLETNILTDILQCIKTEVHD